YRSAMELAVDLGALAEGRLTQARVGEGSLLRRALAQARLVLSGAPVEYRSARTLLGLPLLHVNTRRRERGARARRARGWIAIAPVAVGVVAIGHLAVGVLSLGAASLGLLAIGGAAAAGGVALGGGLGVGLVATGGA